MARYQGKALLSRSLLPRGQAFVPTLEKVLDLKKDPLNGVSSPDDALKGCVDIHIVAGEAFEKCLRRSCVKVGDSLNIVEMI